MNKMKLLLTLAIPVLVFQETQAQSSRLTAQAHWIHNGAEFKRNDSTAYTYLSTSRGGDLVSMLKYDEAINWSFVMGDTQNNNMRWVQEFDASSNLSTAVSQQWDGFFTFSWINQFKHIYSYNSANQKTSMVIQHWDGTSAWITDSKNVYSYNAANQLYLDQYQLWDGVSSYVPNTQVTYYYDPSGNLINETGVMFVSTTPVFTTQVNYTYNSANKQLTETHGMWNGAAWDNTEMNTNTYDTTGNRTSMLHEIFTGGVFENDMLHLYSDYSGGNALTEIVQTWDNTGSGSWMDMYHYAYTYNSNGKMTSALRMSNDISIGWTYTFGDTKANYYYGSFVSVKNVSNMGGTASMYPVPAQNMLNIDLNWSTTQDATATIVDMQGRTIRSVNIAAGTKHAGISVADLANGMYVVMINGTTGQIVKQIVVAH